MTGRLPMVNRRVAFFGGKPLSARSLRFLHQFQECGTIEIVAVVPREKGARGWWSGPLVEEIHEAAERLGLRILRDESELLGIPVDLGISVLHSRILPPPLLRHPTNGFVNLHGAPLPEYRGCNVCTHAILNGEVRFAATLHRMDEKPDHGDVIELEWFDIPPTCTARTLMLLVERAALQLFRRVLPKLLAQDFPTIPQFQLAAETGRKTGYYSRNSLQDPAIRQVQWDWPRERILRHVRAFDFPPFPPAFAWANDGSRLDLTMRNIEAFLGPEGAAQRAKLRAADRYPEGAPPCGGETGDWSLWTMKNSNACIPLCDLKTQLESIRAEIDEAVNEVVSSCQFIGGPVLDRFAEEFARYCRVAHAVPCGNGTEALRAAILALLGEGDDESEIITVAHTFAATAEAIAAARYRPVFVDVDPSTYLMDCDQLDAAWTRRTVAVIPVHLYGQMADMPRLVQWARDRNLAVIEDAAQAQGADFDGVRPGQCSDAAAFSFYPGKNLGAWGDAGAVVCNHPRVASRIAEWIDHGRTDKHTHRGLGWNARMDAIQAAVLRVKLRHLDRWNERRRAAAAHYRTLLGNRAECILPLEAANAHHVYHQYVIQTPQRQGTMALLEEHGISCGIHYPTPVHEQPAYRYLGYAPDDLPITHRICGRILSLPMYPELTGAQILRIATVLHQVTRTRSFHFSKAESVTI